MAVPQEVWVEWAPTSSVYGTPTWQVMAYPLRSAYYRRGMKRAAQRVEAGEATFVFDNRSRHLDPTNPQGPFRGLLTPRKPIRIRMRHNGRTVTLWSGFTGAFTPSWSLNAASVTIQATDDLGLYAGTPAPVSAFRTVVASTRPRWWWPLDEGGGDTAFNLGFDPVLGTHYDVNLKGQPLLPYGTESSVAYGNTGNSRTEILAGGARVVPSFTFGFILQMDEKPTATAVPFSQGPGASGIQLEGDLGFRVGTDGLCMFGITDGANTSQMKGPRIDFGRPVLILGRYGNAGAGQIMTLHVDNAQINGPFSGPFFPRVGAVRIGNGAGNTAPFKGQMSHVMYWDYALTTAQLGQIWTSFDRPRIAETATQRIGWLLDQAGDVGARDMMEQGLDAIGAYRGGLSTLDAITRAAATEHGLFLVDPDGRPTFYARWHQGVDGGTYSTRPEGADLGLQDLNIDMDERGYFTVATAQVSTPNPVDITVRHPNADQAGDLPWAPETEYLNAYTANQAARRVLGDAIAVPHLTGANHYATDDSMVDALTLDVWDTCTVEGFPPDDAGTGPFIAWGSANPGGFWGGSLGWAGPPRLRQVSRVLGVEVDMDFVGMTTHKRMDLEPAPRTPLPLASHDFENDSHGWTYSVNAIGGIGNQVSRVGNAIGGTWSGYLAAQAAGDTAADWVLTTPRVGQALSAAVWVRPFAAPGHLRDASLRVIFKNANGVQVGDTVLGPTIMLDSTGAMRLYVNARVPQQVSTVTFQVRITGAPANAEYVLDDFRLWSSEAVVG